jgi:hypothetical protein
LAGLIGFGIFLALNESPSSESQIDPLTRVPGPALSSNGKANGDHRIHLTNTRPIEKNHGEPKVVDDFVNEFRIIDERLSGVDLRESRLKLMSLAAANLTIEELKELADSSIDKVYHTDLTGFIALRYAAEDPKRGIDWLIQESKIEDSSSASMAFASSCKFDSFPADVLDKFASDKKKALFLQGLMSQASVDLNRDALKYLQLHPEVGRQNGNLIPSCFDKMLENGEFQNSLDLCSILEEPSLRKQEQGKVFEKAALMNSALALELLESMHNDSNDSERNVAITSIATSWGYSQPDKVAAWVDRLPTQQEQDSAKEGLVMAITHSDPSSALEWARSINDKSRRETLVFKLVETLSITDPDLIR